MIRKKITDEENSVLEIMEEIRTPIINLQNKIRGKKNIRNIATSLYEFLLELDIFNTLDKWLERFDNLGMQDKVKEYDQVPKMVIEILDQIVEVLGEEVVDLREFTRILISGFEEKEIGIIPMSIDQVNIGDISRVKGRNIKALFIIGVNDGVIPYQIRKRELYQIGKEMI